MERDRHVADQGDELLLVDRGKVKAAFVEWRKAWSGIKQENTLARSAPMAFSKFLRNRLALVGGKDIKIDLPMSDASWSRFIKSESIFRLRQDICWQIFFSTAIDVTPNQILYKSPMNSTDMITLGKVGLINSKENTGFCTIKIDWIKFESTEFIPVHVDQIKKGKDSISNKQSIGTVRYLIKNASLAIHNCDELHPRLIRLSPGESSAEGICQGIVLSIDRKEEGRWRAELPADGSALQGEASNVYLADVVEDLGNSIEFTVSASVADIYPEVCFFNSNSINTNEDYKFRNELQQQVMRNRIRDLSRVDRFILSFAVVDKP